MTWGTPKDWDWPADWPWPQPPDVGTPSIGTVDVYAYDESVNTWFTVWVGAVEVAEEATFAGPTVLRAIVAGVVNDPPAGIGTWAWWVITFTDGSVYNYWLPPVTTAGKYAPAEPWG